LIDFFQNYSNRINISEYSFFVSSYRLNRSKNYSKQFTVSGDTYIYAKGINPAVLNVKAFCKADNSSALTALENAFVSGEKFSFSIDGILFSDMTLSEYSAENNNNNTVTAIDMTFTSSAGITAEGDKNE
jgi:hypothetical protein